ncbi:MAG: protein translocase subunit SecD, partial [Bacteroidales bacterium]|nr:protein translocase subunit SecD [Bacteroidales bacterium]
MQNKGVIKLLALLLALFTVYQLSFTFVTRHYEKKAKEYAESPKNAELARQMANNDNDAYEYYLDSIRTAKETYYLDSLGTIKIYMWQDYRKCKEQELNLGLDLKGGMNVMMEISVPDIIYALSGNSDDATFRKAMRQAEEQHLNSQKDFVDLFGEAYAKLDPNAKLAPIFLYEFKDKITVNSTNDEVLKVIKDETDLAIDRSYQILRTRIDRFGVAQPNIQKLESSGRILVELPGIKDPKRVRKLLQGTAQLEFWETYNFNEIAQYFAEANELLAKSNAVKAENAKEEEVKEGEDVALLDQMTADDSLKKAQEQANMVTFSNYMLFSVSETGVPYQTARVGMAAVKDTANINRMLKMTSSVFPRNIRFAWCVKPNKSTMNGIELIDLVALKANRENKCSLGGEVVTEARQDYDQNGRVEVSIQMNADGAREWKRLTGDNIGRQIAIVLDNYVYSYPVVNDEIPGGRSQISGGDMTVEEAQDLANILKAGKLPAPARILEENVVGPSLGQEAITSGFWSFIIAFCLVLIYMIFFYSKAGIAADIALIVNIIFFFGVIASFGTVLTLPGIAGIVLTLGMAVDSNVIIFERIKEEIAAGKGIRLAVADGFKAAYSAILDGQITTFLTGFILFEFGTGPVQGFATTLMIGICTSLFTSIFITRLILDRWLDKNKDIAFSTNITRNFLKNTKFDFIKFGKTAFIIGALMIVISVCSWLTLGLNLGIDFQGGRNYVVRFDKEVSVAQVREALASVDEFKDDAPEVKTYGPSRQVKITTKYKIKSNDPDVDAEIQGMLYNGLKQFYTKEMTY